MNIIAKPVKEMLVRLEELSDEHYEVTDTDVRESLHLALNYYFVWGNSTKTMPINYAMLSLEGDKAISKLIEDFLHSVNSIPEIGRIPAGKERLALLQDSSIRTPKGYQYDHYIGHVDDPLPPEKPPQDMYEDGIYE